MILLTFLAGSEDFAQLLRIKQVQPASKIVALLFLRDSFFEYHWEKILGKKGVV